MTAVPPRPSADAWLSALFFAGVVALVPAPLFATSMAYFGLLIVTVIFLIHIAGGGWRRLRLQPLDLPIAAFLVVRVLSTLTSVAPATSWKGLEKSGLLLAYYPLAHMPLAAARRKAGIYIHLAAIALAAVVGVVEFGWGFQPRVTARAGGYTTFAEMLAVALCLWFAFVAFARGRRAWPWVGAAALPLAALALTFCRGQWLALAAGAVLIGWFKDRRVLAFVLVLALAAGMAAVLAPAGLPSGRFTLGDPAFENYRDVLWRGGLKVAFARPLTGFGPQTIQIIFPDQTRFYSPVAGVIGWHNDFLQLLTESGLGAVAAWLWLGLAAAGAAWTAFRNSGADAATRALGLGLAAAALTLAIDSMVGNVITDPAMLIQFVILWGLFTPLAEGRRADEAAAV